MIDDPWHAGAIGRDPKDQSLVWRDDAVNGPNFYAASPEEAELAAHYLNKLEKKVNKKVKK